MSYNVTLSHTRSHNVKKGQTTKKVTLSHTRSHNVKKGQTTKKAK